MVAVNNEYIFEAGTTLLKSGDEVKMKIKRFRWQLYRRSVEGEKDVCC